MSINNEERICQRMEDEEANGLPAEFVREPDQFIIDSDSKAEWALKKIREAEDEHTRLMSLIDQEQQSLDERKAAFDKALERETEYLKYALNQYMRTVPCKATKTQESYQLLSGKLIRKKPAVDYEVDNERLTNWLRENKRDDLLKVAPRWADVKKLLTADPVSGAATITDTGELVDGVTAIETPEKFTIKFN